MMMRLSQLIALVIATATLATLPLAALAQQPKAPATSTPAASATTGAGGEEVARIGDEVILRQDLEQSVATQLARIDEQRHALLSEKLDQLIGERLLALEAKRRSVTVEQLLKTEVYPKAPEVSDAEVTDFMNQNRARLPRGGDEAQLKLRVWDYLRSQRVAQARQAYVEQLREKTPVTVSLAEPTPVRVAMGPEKGFVRGPKDAPVVVVEFSDFQCPYCKTVVGTLKALAAKYPTQVKWVFRDFPIAALHPGAAKAHEAARCAGDQGKFWEYHDLLFEKSPQHSPAELKQYAQDLQLDAAKFGQCLDAATHQEAVSSDMEEGARLGVTGTPSFFINGRALVGNQPLAAFEKVIASELAASKRATR
jgi:protein-disulfide isomerase